MMHFVGNDYDPSLVSACGQLTLLSDPELARVTGDLGRVECSVCRGTMRFRAAGQAAELRAKHQLPMTLLSGDGPEWLDPVEPWPLGLRSQGRNPNRPVPS